MRFIPTKSNSTRDQSAHYVCTISAAKTATAIIATAGYILYHSAIESGRWYRITRFNRVDWFVVRNFYHRHYHSFFHHSSDRSWMKLWFARHMLGASPALPFCRVSMFMRMELVVHMYWIQPSLRLYRVFQPRRSAYAQHSSSRHSCASVQNHVQYWESYITTDCHHRHYLQWLFGLLL